MKLIIGLGNPGKKYENTRHNAGFMAIDEAAKHFNVNITKEFKNGLCAEFIHNNEKVIFLKPQKFMNLSGEVVREYVDFYKIDIDDILVIYDDMDTDTGAFKLKLKGSSGGHNGLKDIERHLGTQVYKRFKIGISKSEFIPVVDYVLGKFTDNEKKEVENVIKIAPSVIEDYLSDSFERVMSKYNK